MKKCYILFFLVFLSSIAYPYTDFQNPRDRKLSTEEVQERGLDLLANEIIENIEEIDLRKTARSAIFETSYGFRWKMVNLHTSKVIIIKVDKNFKLISARNSDNSRVMIP